MTCYWPANPWSVPPAGRCSPGCSALMSFLLRSYPGSQNLGCYADRGITGNATTPSLHRDGRAIDWGPTGDEQRNHAWGFFTKWGRALGVQLVADYRHNRYCKPVCGPGIMSWGKTGSHFHIELTPTAAADTRPIEERLKGSAMPDMSSFICLAYRQEGGGDRQPHYKLCQADSGRWYVLCMNGATLRGAVPTEIFWIPGVALPHPLVGQPLHLEYSLSLRAAVVIAGDGGTFVYPEQ